MTAIQIRQGDVYLRPVSNLPKGCKPIDPENGTRFVLAHGEATGHAHAIYEFTSDTQAERQAARAGEMAEAALARIQALRTAQMWAALDGEWYLEIRLPSQMKHEEHDPPTIPVGVYHCPIQVEKGPDNVLRRVAD